MFPENTPWKINPAAPAAQSAVLHDAPNQAGAYVARVKLAAGKMVPPHTHPEERIYTVLSGVFYIGMGERYDDALLVAYPPGAIVILPARQAHFHAAKAGEWVVQINSNGPTSFDYVDSEDDPRGQAD